MSTEYEQSAKVLDDPIIAGYVARLAQKIEQNSDANMPIMVRLIDSDEPAAYTLPGGHQYINRGLLLRLESEGELASILARGIAHTALRSATKELTRTAMMQIAGIPIVFSGQGGTSSVALGLAIPLTLIKTRREDELEADYFGVQYLYKSGYDPDCFARFLQHVWSSNSGTKGAALKADFDPSPPVSERLDALRKERADLSPKHVGAIVSTPEFDGFMERLRVWKSEVPGPKQPSEKPLLLRKL